MNIGRFTRLHAKIQREKFQSIKGVDMVTIAEALEGVELEPGKTYRCNVRGLQIELRVVAAGSNTLPDSLLPDPLNEEDIMYDAWTELPSEIGEVRTVKVTRGERLMPDPPLMPDYGDDLV